MDNWEQYERDDLHYINKMISLGYEVIFHAEDIYNNRITPMNPPHNEVGFKLHDLYIWKMYDFGPIKNDGSRDILTEWNKAKTDKIGLLANPVKYNTLSELIKSL